MNTSHTNGLANAARGETVLDVGGMPHRLCLTLGALAQLETHFGVTGPAELAARLKTLTANDVLVVLHVLIAGGGGQLSVEDLAAAPLSPTAAATAIVQAFLVATGGQSGSRPGQTVGQ